MSEQVDKRDFFNDLQQLYNSLNPVEKNAFQPFLLAAIGNVTWEYAMATIYGLMSKHEQELISGLITPRVNSKQKDTMSWGPELYGYTLRLGQECIIKGQKQNVPDVIKPKEMLLVCTEETVCLPHNVQAYLWAKSSYTRQGIFYALCPIEPAYSGTLSFPICNMSDSDVKLYVGQGICQVCFLRMPEHNEQPEDSKYNGSNGVVPFSG